MNTQQDAKNEQQNRENKTSEKTYELKRLTNQALESNLKSIFKKEAFFLHQAILHIKEIDRRRMHLELGFPSLYTYLTKEIGYSEGAAQRRIDAARLMNELPEIGAKIQAGELKLSHITLVQKASREVKLENNTRVLPQEKKALLEEICTKSNYEAKQILATKLNIKLKENKVIPQKDESVYYGVTLSKEQQEKFKQVQALLSHIVPDGDMTKLMEYFFDKVIEQKTKPPRAKKEKPAEQPAATMAVDSETVRSQKVLKTQERAIATATVAVKIPKTVTPALRKQVLLRDQCCQYIDPSSGRQCGSKWQLETDHRHAKWAGGSNEIPNLRVLCKQHNIFVYKKAAGIRLN